MIGPLPDGAHGFDCNTPVTQDVARKFYNAGYRFAIRYVPRVTRQDHDVSATELINILLGGLAVMLVQHVSSPGWVASASLGTSYGKIAATEARLVGLPRGVTLWCDLEEVASLSVGPNTAAYCNAWHDQVKAAGYEPGLYVGYRAGLTAVELYRSLRFQRYWSAYNLNADDHPIVRGVQMHQRPYPKPAARVAGVQFEYDENVIKADAFGSSPILLIP